MSGEATDAAGHTYRIGAVSRLTGVPADTLRVWERRYRVVTPVRSDSGTRLYGSEDVARLSLIKRLVDQGDAISSVAPLTLGQLRERAQGVDLTPPPRRAGPCRVVVLGRGLAERLAAGVQSSDGIEIVGTYDSHAALLDAAGGASPDAALLEYPTLHGEQVREILQLMAHSGVTRALVVYGFASRATLERLDARRVTLRRAPVDTADLRRWCLTQQGMAPRPDPSPGEVDLMSPPPPRRFTEVALARIAMASPTMRCECPHHLVDLVTALDAFELYCQECESRGSEDAALHAYLHAATGRARALMETALARVVEAEGISIDVADRDEGSG